jgi:hypothetical protein
MRASRPLVLFTVPLVVAGLGATSASAADRASQSPHAILSAVQRDLRKVKSYRVTGSLADGTDRLRLTADIDVRGRAKVTVRLSGATLRVIELPSAVYLNGDAGFWKSAGGDGAAVAERLAGKWLKTDAQATHYTSWYADLGPKSLARCVTSGLGTLSMGGTATVGGQRAVVLVDAGDKPGTTPSKLYVTASGPALPLREIQTGKTRPGGKVDERCGSEDDETTAGDVRFSRFDEPVRVAAPKGAIPLPTDDGPSTTPASATAGA